MVNLERVGAWVSAGAACALILGTPAVVGAENAASPPAEEDLAAIDEVDLEKLLSAFDSGTEPVRYAARDNRDPFRSLLEGDLSEGQRERGPAGTSIDELDLKGILRDAKSGDYYALMVANDARSHRIFKNQKVWDGMVVEVLPNKVVFEQTEIDPVSGGFNPPKRVEIALRSK